MSFWFKQFKSFKPFNPLLSSSPAARGRLSMRVVKCPSIFFQAAWRIFCRVILAK
jgi:hypothetical protein